MRIYISSTTQDLGRHRQEVITQLTRMGHMPVCMEHHAASDVIPLDECLRDVAASEVYVGIFGWRYGYIPPAMDRSITEMEYRKASEIGIHKLVFLSDETVECPDPFRDSGQDGDRIRALRDELKKSMWVAFFTSPDSLAKEVTVAVSILFMKIMTGIFIGASKGKEQDLKRQKAEIQKHIEERNLRLQRKSERMSGSIPDRLTRHFQDRVAEISALRRAFCNRDLRMVSICGRSGVGKTALAAKLVQELIQEDAKGTASQVDSIDGFAHIPLDKQGSRNPDSIIERLVLTMEPEIAENIKQIWNQPSLSTRDRLLGLFRGPLGSNRCLIVLDNMESVMDAENRIDERFIDLREFVDTFLECENNVLLIATSQRLLAFSPNAEIASLDKAIQIPLDGGLPENFSVALLRQLDVDGRLGLRKAPEETLCRIARRCQNIPRTLETLVVTLKNHPTWTPEALLANETLMDQLVDNPAQQLYMSLSSDAERLVMQVLAVYDKPVPAVAVRAMLPALPIDDILDRFVRNYVASFAHGCFWLRPLDRDYAYKQIPETGSDYSKSILHGRAAQYFLAFPCPPRESRASLEDIAPRLDAIEHLLAAGQDEDATRQLLDNDLLEDLHWWGHYSILTDLCRRLLNRKISARCRIPIHIQLGKVERNLGRLEEAKNIYENALPLVSEAADPLCDIGLMNALGDISYFLSDLTNASIYLRRAEKLLAINPHPRLHSENSGDLANVLFSQNELEQAEKLYLQAIAFAREAHDRIYEGIWHGNLGNLYGRLFHVFGNPDNRQRAIDSYQQAIAIAKEKKDRRHESHWNGTLGHFYSEIGDIDSAEKHLQEALMISHFFHYVRGLPTQIEWMSEVIEQRIQTAEKTGDRQLFFGACLGSSRLVHEIGIPELTFEISPHLDGYIYNLIKVLAVEEKVDDALSWGRKYFIMDPETLERDKLLGRISTGLGNQTGRQDAFLFGAEAYSRAIQACTDEHMLPDLHGGRATAYARAGKIEEALADYAEVMNRKSKPIGAALSRAEVLIWAGRYGEAKDALDVLHAQLETEADKAIHTWLTGHALNLSGCDCSAQMKALEEMRAKSIHLSYGTGDIESYLRKLDPAKFSPDQIKIAWKLQAIIADIAGSSEMLPG